MYVLINIVWPKSLFFLCSFLLVFTNCHETILSDGGLVCSSDCIRNGGGSYFFCNVEGSSWDYCSPQSNEGPLVRKQFTIKHRSCLEECSLHNPWLGRSYYRCPSYYSEDRAEYEECSPTYVEYIQTNTRFGAKCDSKCGKFGTSYFWCYDSTGEWEYCSPPSHQYALTKMKELRKNLERIEEGQKCREHPYVRNMRKRRHFPPYSVDETRRAGSILEYAAMLVALGSIGNMIVNVQPNNPIYRYAYLDRVTPDDPIIPLMISARITVNSLNPKGSRNASAVPKAIEENVNKLDRNYLGRNYENNDENGHLIGYQNGGPFELYNFAPQPRSLNRGIVRGNLMNNARSAWLQSENAINAYVRSGREVDQTVVCVYEDNVVHNPRPLGFAIHLIFYNADGTINYECDDFYSNDPNSLPDRRNGLKK